VNGAEGKEMISLRLAVPVVLVAAAVAGCFTYFVSPSPPPPVEADQRLRPTLPDVAPNIDRRPSSEEEAELAFRRAASAILRRLPDAQASARTNELPITGRIPLPKRRPRSLP
jgi:hypothetical protein